MFIYFLLSHHQQAVNNITSFKKKKPRKKSIAFRCCCSLSYLLHILYLQIKQAILARRSSSINQTLASVFVEPFLIFVLHLSLSLIFFISHTFVGFLGFFVIDCCCLFLFFKIVLFLFLLFCCAELLLLPISSFSFCWNKSQENLEEELFIIHLPCRLTTNMFSRSPGGLAHTGKKSTDDIKRRLQAVLGYSPYAVYFGFVPLVIYLGFKLGPDPNTPDFSLVNLLPIG